jgi:hypothetical protein
MKHIACLSLIVLLPSCASGTPAPTQPPAVTALVVSAVPSSALPAASTHAFPLPLGSPSAATASIELADPPPQPEPGTSVFRSPAKPAASPPFHVQSVVVISSSVPTDDAFGGDTVMLFESIVPCAAAVAANAPPHVSVTLRWEPKNRTVFSNVSVVGGKVSSHKGSVEVIAAPKKKGAKGKVRIDPLPDGNVDGGVLEAEWCG